MSALKYIVFSLVILFPFFGFNQTLVKGKVLHKGKGLKGVRVSSQANANLFLPVKTDAKGNFEVESSGKGDQLMFQKKGYLLQATTLVDDKDLVVNLQKQPRRKIRLATRRRKSKCPPSNPHCGCCFYKGTKVLLNEGSQKNIELIKPGDVLLEMNLKNFTLQQDTVQTVDSVFHDHLIQLEFENGTTLISTGDHPYFVEGRGWCSFDSAATFYNYGIKTMELNVGDLCVYFSKGELKSLAISKIQPSVLSGVTYNIKGKHGSNYFANGVVVSNEKTPLTLEKNSP